MKVIDLLNKIANGEEVPKKIKYKGRILYYDSEDSETNNYNATFNYYDKDGENALFEGWIGQYLNDEVEIIKEELEIIEEDKPIEELLIEQDCPSSNYYIRNEFGTKCGLTKHSKMIAEKVNEIIDVVNELKERE